MALLGTPAAPIPPIGSGLPNAQQPVANGTPITPTSKQFAIMKALTAQLQAITPMNGYAYDLSQVVFRGRVIFGADDPIPMLSILEAPRPGITTEANDTSFVRLTSWELLVQGWAPDDKQNPLDPVYPLKASVERQLARCLKTRDADGRGQYPAEYMLGGLISSMRLGPGVCRPPDAQVSSKAFFWLPLTVQYKEDLSAPFV
jgi:hypothetical protein